MTIIKFLRMPKKQGGSAYKNISRFGQIMRPFWRTLLRNAGSKVPATVQDLGADAIKIGADMLTDTILKKTKEKVGTGKVKKRTIKIAKPFVGGLRKKKKNKRRATVVGGKRRKKNKRQATVLGGKRRKKKNKRQTVVGRGRKKNKKISNKKRKKPFSIFD